MSVYFDLFVSQSALPHLAADPTWSDRQLPALVAQSPLHYWQPGDPIRAEGERLLIGVATWSGYDMKLLDAICTALVSATAPHPWVDVFNMASCAQMGDFHTFIPGIGQVYQPPVAGIWRAGVLEWYGQGSAARDKVARMFGLNAMDIVAFIQDRVNLRAASRGA